MYNNKEYQYKYITTSATTTVFTGRGTLHNLTLNAPVAGVVRICDATTGTTPNVGLIAASTAAGTLNYDVVISKGLIIDTSGATDITVSYAQD